VTTTWMQINHHLLSLTGEAKYAEELEKTIYNALLASQHPVKGSICYFTPLNGAKPYGAVNHGVAGVSCCTSSIPRSLALLPSLIGGSVPAGAGKGVVVNLYTSGSFDIPWEKQTVGISMETDYPRSGKVSLTIALDEPASFSLHLRVPAWTKSFTATALASRYEGKPGDYLAIAREWKPGDTVAIEIDMAIQILSGAPTYPGHVAVKRGPQLLALESISYADSDLFLAGLGSNQPELAEATGGFARGWTGSQAYLTDGYAGNATVETVKKRLRLIPLADAGQLGHEYRVWLQKPNE
jgi:uncharacterized protein